MKKTVSFVLLLVMGLFLCACGGETGDAPIQASSEVTDGAVMETTESFAAEDAVITDHPMLSSIYGEWALIVREEEANDRQLVPYTRLVFSDDWTCMIDGKSATWRISENSREDELRIDIDFPGAELNGAILSDEGYLMCTYGVTFYTGTFGRQEPQIQEIEITLDNWQDYFEFREFLYCNEDAFGTFTDYDFYWCLVPKESIGTVIDSSVAVACDYTWETRMLTVYPDTNTFEWGELS